MGREEQGVRRCEWGRSPGPWSHTELGASGVFGVLPAEPGIMGFAFYMISRCCVAASLERNEKEFGKDQAEGYL